MLRLILITLVFAYSASVSAQGVNYNYLQVSYGRVDFDELGQVREGDVPGISGSYAVTEHLHIYGEYQTADLGAGVNFNLTEMDVGFHTELSSRCDIYANVGYVNHEFRPGTATNQMGFTEGCR